MHARTYRAGVAAAALLAGAVTAGAADMTSGSAAAAANPLLAPWSGPYAGVPPFDKARPEHLGPALEASMAENLAEVDRIANDPAAPTFENTIAAMERTGRTLDRVEHRVRHLRLEPERRRRAGGRARDVAEARGIQRQDHAEREAVLAHRRGLRDARDRGAHARSRSGSPGSTTRTSPAPARSSIRRRRKSCRASTSGSRRSTRISARTCSPTRASRCCCSTTRRRSPACRRRRAPPRPTAAESRGQKGKWAVAQHAFEHRAVPHLFRPPRSAREGRGACSSTAATTAARPTTTRSSPRSSRCAPSARSCSATRRTRTGGSRTRWRKTPERAMELMEAVWTPAVARVREEVADMQAVADQEKARHQDRALGLPLLRREGAQGEVRPRRERGQALPAAREAARRHVLHGVASCSASASSRSTPARCRSSIPTCGSGR